MYQRRVRRTDSGATGIVVTRHNGNAVRVDVVPDARPHLTESWPVNVLVMVGGKGCNVPLHTILNRKGR